jgi:anti-sigma B factor antagonist
MPLKIDIVANKPGIARLLLAGSLDSETAPQLDKALLALDPAPLLVVLDMKDLEFISSAGLRVIFAARKRQAARRGEVIVSNMGPGIRKVFEIVNALPSFTVFTSDAEMDDYLAAFQKRQA